MELGPIARARRTGEEFYQTLPFVRCVYFLLIVVKAIQPARTITEANEVIRMDRAIPRLRNHTFIPRRAQDLNLRVSAVTLPRGIIAPLFYSQSTDLPVPHH